MLLKQRLHFGNAFGKLLYSSVISWRKFNLYDVVRLFVGFKYGAIDAWGDCVLIPYHRHVRDRVCDQSPL